jgi:hypothetical protein
MNLNFEPSQTVLFTVQGQQFETRIINVSWNIRNDSLRTVVFQADLLQPFRLEWNTDWRRDHLWRAGEWIKVKLLISPSEISVEFPYTEHQWIPTPRFKLGS